MIKKIIHNLLAYIINSFCMLGVAVIATSMFQDKTKLMLDGALAGFSWIVLGAIATIGKTFLEED